MPASPAAVAHPPPTIPPPDEPDAKAPAPSCKARDGRVISILDPGLGGPCGVPLGKTGRFAIITSRLPHHHPGHHGPAPPSPARTYTHYLVKVIHGGETAWSRRFRDDQTSVTEGVEQARAWLRAQCRRDRVHFLCSPALLVTWALCAALAWWALPALSAWGFLPLLIALPLAWWAAPSRKPPRVTARLGGFSWTRNDFCRGWLITGDTGAGKTFAINRLLHSVFQHEPDWGGLCCDEKGIYHETLVTMAARYDRQDDLVLLQTRPDHAGPDWSPPVRLNLLSDHTIPSSTYAQAIVDTAANLNAGADDKGFFKTQAHKQIGEAIHLMRLLGLTPTLQHVNEILQSEPMLKAALQRLEPAAHDGNDAARQCRDHFLNFLRQPPDQLGGVRATIDNYLGYFSHPDIVEVFGAEVNTFDFAAVDQGAIICISMPQKFQTERRYVTTLLKLLFYTHALRRFDPRPPGRRPLSQDNLLVCWQDEAQRFVTESDGNVDVIRQAHATTVMAAQSKTSFLPALPTKEKAEVLLLNLRNRLIFRAADRACAESSADFIGKRTYWKKTYTRSKGQISTARTKEEAYWVKPHELAALPKFTAVVMHCEHGYRRRVIPPVDPDGGTPAWYH
ncbi:MAG: type IV secretion system DNA-binding domain-containing protein [Verrucomicrobia bacterium]|nr:type IV secretion system DNA-binding domain-containing protein [Verrucomicrobiota bacterium]